MQGALRALAENRKVAAAATQESVKSPAAQDDSAAVDSVEVTAEVRKESTPAGGWGRLAPTAGAMVRAARLGRELTATKNSKKRARDKERRRLRQVRFGRRQLVRDAVSILRAICELHEEEDTNGDDRLPNLVDDDTSSGGGEPEGDSSSSGETQRSNKESP
jgi:hypothetical protein